MKVIQLTKGQVAIVDDEDFAELAQYRWHFAAAGYAARKARVHEIGSSRHVIFYMHRLISKAKPGEMVDHKNLNKLDNRRENLRIATEEQNHANKPVQRNNKLGVKGISFNRGSKKNPYIATIGYGKKHIYIGSFPTIEEASAAYCAEAQKAFGEFARFN